MALDELAADAKQAFAESVPDAMYRNGQAFFALKYCGDAKIYFQELLRRYPKTEWKKDANEQLKTLVEGMLAEWGKDGREAAVAWSGPLGDAARGAALYGANCQTCHGSPDGKSPGTRGSVSTNVRPAAAPRTTPRRVSFVDMGCLPRADWSDVLASTRP